MLSSHCIVRQPTFSSYIFKHVLILCKTHFHSKPPVSCGHFPPKQFKIGFAKQITKSMYHKKMCCEKQRYKRHTISTCSSVSSNETFYKSCISLPSSLLCKPCLSKNSLEPFASQMCTFSAASSFAFVDPRINHSNSLSIPFQNVLFVVRRGKTSVINK